MPTNGTTAEAKLSFQERIQKFELNGATHFWQLGLADDGEAFLHQAHALAVVLSAAFESQEVDAANLRLKSGAVEAIGSLIALGLLCREMANG
jgi:hypothetical protein